MKNFWATEAELNAVMLAYNLMSLFRQALLKTSCVRSFSGPVQHTQKPCATSGSPRPLASREQARQVVFEYIDVFYNRIRRHAKISN